MTNESQEPRSTVSSPAFTQSFDAMDWAKAFVEHVQRKPSIATDEGTMIGWFANALMRGYDEHARRFAPAALTPSDATTDDDAIVAIVNLTTASRAVGFAAGRGEDDEHAARTECAAADVLRSALASRRSPGAAPRETVVSAERVDVQTIIVRAESAVESAVGLLWGHGHRGASENLRRRFTEMRDEIFRQQQLREAGAAPAPQTSSQEASSAGHPARIPDDAELPRRRDFEAMVLLLRAKAYESGRIGATPMPSLRYGADANAAEIAASDQLFDAIDTLLRASASHSAQRVESFPRRVPGEREAATREMLERAAKMLEGAAEYANDEEWEQEAKALSKALRGASARQDERRLDERARSALRKAMEWAANYPLGGDGSMDRVAAETVYEACREALESRASVGGEDTRSASRRRARGREHEDAR